jgi:Cu(I)/Ag(I) efflux system membrane protein CusA/SilA
LIESVIEFSGKNRFLILTLSVLLAVGGWVAFLNTPIDAIPDLSDVQVIIKSDWAGQSPQEIEDQVTYPLTTAMLGVPGVSDVRGYSFFGFSLVYVVFEDGTDLYWARSRVQEYLSYARNQLPEGVVASLGPDATGVGWVYQYALTSDRHSLGELRSLQDWFIRYQLATVDGVSEVATVGGGVMQYQIEVDPTALQALDIPLKKVIKAVRESNVQVGGRLLEMAEREYMIRGLGYLKSLDDIRVIQIAETPGGGAIYLEDVANVTRGPDIRRGVAELDGKGEVVAGVVVMRYGENALKTIDGVKAKLEELKPGLPEGVKIVEVYDRSNLIRRASDSLKTKLIEEIAVVALVCVLFLLHLPSSAVAIITLPLGVLFSYLIMYGQGVNANIMSMGGIAIAIGAMVDAAVVMIENAHKHLEDAPPEAKREDVILEAAKEVGPSLFYSLLVIVVAFFPVFMLGQQAGRLFKPLAFTKTYAMAGAALLSVTLVPVLMILFIRGGLIPEKYNPISRILIFFYKPIIWLTLRLRWLVVVAASVILIATIYPLTRLGSEFMPPINEGDILYMPTTFPGISITESKRLLQIQDKIISNFPEVKTVFGKIGRFETATDPAPLSMVETTITLKDPSEWRPEFEGDIKKLMNAMNDQMQIPGMTNAWTMPIKTRIDMLATGIKTPIGIKIYGNDLQELERLAQKVEVAVKGVPNTRSAYAERTAGGNYIDYKIDRQAITRYGLSVADVQQVIMAAVGGMNVTTTVEGRERYPVSIRYPREYRDDLQALSQILITTPKGLHVPIDQVAELSIHQGPPAIKSENSLLMAVVYVDIEGVDLGTYVERAKKTVDAAMQGQIPPGYYIEWSGQFEYMEAANKRLKVAIPLTVLLIFVLLQMNFGKLSDTLIVMLSLPFGVVGGIWLMYMWPDFAGWLDALWPGVAVQSDPLDFSVAVGVGFIALAGVAAETGVVMVLYLDLAWSRALKKGVKPDRRLLWQAITTGAVDRVRPKIMTVVSTMVGLLPLLVGTEVGSRVMQRIAVPMVGGMVSSTILTLIVIPAVYAIWKEFEMEWHLFRGKPL